MVACFTSQLSCFLVFLLYNARDLVFGFVFTHGDFLCLRVPTDTNRLTIWTPIKQTLAMLALLLDACIVYPYQSISHYYIQSRNGLHSHSSEQQLVVLVATVNANQLGTDISTRCQSFNPRQTKICRRCKELCMSSSTYTYTYMMQRRTDGFDSLLDCLIADD